jgi:transposase
MIIFPDLAHVEVEGVEIAEEIILTLRTTSPAAPCPSCGTVSSRIQSRYTRTLRDLPSVGRPLCLILHVRRFFCKKSTCAQKIFVERLPELCRPHARAAPNGSKRPSVNSDSQSGARPEPMWEVSWASAEVAIRFCAWFANRTRRLNQPHELLGWTTGHASADCAMEP